MKTLFLLLILTTPLFIYSQDPMKFQRLEDYKLKGKVKQYVHINKFKNDTLIFNEDGYLTESKEFVIYRNERYVSTYTYKNDHIVSSISSHDSVTSYYEYFYDSLGRFTHETCNGKMSEKVFYDARNNDTAFFQYEEDGTMKAKMIQVFDEQNRVIERKIDWKDEWRNSTAYFWYTDSFEIEIIYQKDDEPLVIVTQNELKKETEWIVDLFSYPFPIVNYKNVRLLNDDGLTLKYYTEYIMPKKNTYTCIAPGTVNVSEYTYEFDSTGNAVQYLTTGDNTYTDTMRYIYYE